MSPSHGAPPHSGLASFPVIPAVSIFPAPSGRLFAAAIVLAALLHGLMGVALWRLWLQRPDLPPGEPVVEVSFVASQVRPPAALQRADRPTEPLPGNALSRAPLALAPPMAPLSPPALLAPAPPPPPMPTPADIATTREVAPAPVPVAPLQSLVSPPRPAAAPPAPARPEYRPTPPAAPPGPPASEAAEPPPPNPVAERAEAFLRARAADEYLQRIVHRLEGYSYQGIALANRGVTVVRLVIARDGKLLEASIHKSSGVPEFDRGVLAGVRASAPFAPLPPDIRGATATFDLPLASVAGR